MPISPAVVDQWFDAEQVRAMGIAYENACRSLGVTQAPDAVTDIIATRIIETARSGESDPVRLYAAVMQWVYEGGAADRQKGNSP